MDDFFELIGLLLKTPSVSYGNSCSIISDDGQWTISFSIDVDHRIGWRVVRKLADSLNDLSENGGDVMFFPSPTDEFCPADRLRWSIRGNMNRMTPKECARTLNSKFPHPVDDVDAWEDSDE